MRNILIIFTFLIYKHKKIEINLKKKKKKNDLTRNEAKSRMGSIVYILEYSSYSVSYMKLTQIESSLLVRVLVYF